MSSHRPFTVVGHAPAFLQAARNRPLTARGEQRLAPLPVHARETIQACAAAHGVPLAELMDGSSRRPVVACRDEIAYRLNTKQPRSSIDEIARWLDRDPAGLMFAIGRYAARGRQRRKAA